jgi:hypothetical protein
VSSNIALLLGSWTIQKRDPIGQHRQQQQSAAAVLGAWPTLSDSSICHPRPRAAPRTRTYHAGIGHGQRRHVHGAAPSSPQANTPGHPLAGGTLPLWRGTCWTRPSRTRSKPRPPPPGRLTTPVVTKYEYAAWRPCADVGRARQSAGGGGGRLRSNSGSPLGWLKLAAMSASSAVAIQLNLIAS